LASSTTSLHCSLFLTFSFHPFTFRLIIKIIIIVCGRYGPWWPLASVLQFLNHIDGRYGSLVGGSAPSQGRYLHRTTERIKANINASSRIRTLVFERTKTVHALDRAATTIGTPSRYRPKNISKLLCRNWGSLSVGYEYKAV
jgi:hypothetical protein